MLACLVEFKLFGLPFFIVIISMMQRSILYPIKKEIIIFNSLQC